MGFNPGGPLRAGSRGPRDGDGLEPEGGDHRSEHEVPGRLDADAPAPGQRGGGGEADVERLDRAVGDDHAVRRLVLVALYPSPVALSAGAVPGSGAGTDHGAIMLPDRRRAVTTALCLGVLYTVWGSTYLAQRLAGEGSACNCAELSGRSGGGGQLAGVNRAL